MPHNCAPCETSAPHRDNDDEDDDENGFDFEFVEVDPTARYGRYKEILGKGACKTVYRAFDEIDGIEVAWNQVKVCDVLQSSEDLERLYSEIHLLKTLKHKNIIKFYHSWVDSKAKNINFITEIFTSGTLRQYRKRHKHVDIKAVKNWSRQILSGLLYLHSHDPPIIHRDLKCDNVFVNGNQGEVKIGDLGLATILQRAHAAHGVIGTPEFMAPELYEGEYTELVDIYSFGMCLLEMVTLEYPYSECANAAQIYKKVSLGKKPAALARVKDVELQHFIEKCLATVSKRLPAKYLLTDPFLLCDGYNEAIGYLSPISQRAMSKNDMNDVGVDVEEGTFKSNTVKISYKQSEPFSSLSCDNSYGFSSQLVGSIGLNKDADHLTNEKLVRSVEVKGRREADTVFLSLRIADSEGRIRNIHFPFEMESDTAMSVASEMVAELDLTDQDVTTIAEVIDASILVLVPEWKPGVAIDETYAIEGEANHQADNECHITVCNTDLDPPPAQPPLLQLEPSETISAMNSILPHNAVAMRVESTMHGRFEVIGDEPCTISSLSSTESLKRVDSWDPRDKSASPITTTTNNKNNTDYHVSSAFSRDGSRADDDHDVGFPNCSGEESMLMGSHETWNCTGPGRPYPSCSSQRHQAMKQIRDSWCSDELLFSSPESLCDPDEFEDDDMLAEEERLLVLKHEQERKDLQAKHQVALIELRKKWQEKRSN